MFRVGGCVVVVLLFRFFRESWNDHSRTGGNLCSQLFSCIYESTCFLCVSRCCGSFALTPSFRYDADDDDDDDDDDDITPELNTLLFDDNHLHTVKNRVILTPGSDPLNVLYCYSLVPVYCMFFFIVLCVCVYVCVFVCV